MSDAQVIELRREDGLDPRVVKELAELSDGTAWQRADRLVELFPVEEYGEADDGKTTGLYSELDAYSDALRREHGIEWAANYMARQRAAAIKWPASTRVQATSFAVHRRLLGEDRQREMQKYLRMADREGFALTAKMLGRFRTDEKGAKPLAPLDERAYKRFNSTAKGLLIGPGRVVKKDDWWNSRHATTENRQVIADVLRTLADEIQP